jgi:hypothetical protein
MTTKIKITYSVQGSVQEMDMYIGNPKDDAPHPLHYQNKWLEDTKNASVSKDLMDSIAKLYQLSKKNNANFEELLSYAMESSIINEKNGLGLKKKVDLTKSAEEYLKKYEPSINEEKKTFTQKEEEKKEIILENKNIKKEVKKSIYQEDDDLLGDNALNTKTNKKDFSNELKKNENENTSSIYGEDDDLL